MLAMVPSKGSGLAILIVTGGAAAAGGGGGGAPGGAAVSKVVIRALAVSKSLLKVSTRVLNAAISAILCICDETGNSPGSDVVLGVGLGGVTGL